MEDATQDDTSVRQCCYAATVCRWDPPCGCKCAAILDKLSSTESGHSDLPDWVPAQEGLRYAQHGLPRATHSGGVFTHHPGAVPAGSSYVQESTGLPGQSKLHTVVPAVLLPPNQMTRTYDVVDIVRHCWARSNMTRDQ